MSTLSDKRPGFFMIENAVIDNANLTPYEIAVYAFIVRHVNGKSGVAFPSVQTIADRTQMSKPKAIDCIASLESKGLLSVARRFAEGQKNREVNHYYVESYTQVVNEVNQRGKPELPEVVNEVNRNNTEDKKTELNTSPAPALQDAETPTEPVPESTPVDKPKSHLPLHPALEKMLGIESTSKPSPKKGRVAPQHPLFCEPLKTELATAIAEYSFNVTYKTLAKEAQSSLFKRISKILKELLSLHLLSAITGEELTEAYRWWGKHNKGANYPAGANTVYTMLLAYRQAKAEYETSQVETPKLIAKTLPDGTVVYGEEQ